MSSIHYFKLSKTIKHSLLSAVLSKSYLSCHQSFKLGKTLPSTLESRLLHLLSWPTKNTLVSPRKFCTHKKNSLEELEFMMISDVLHKVTDLPQTRHKSGGSPWNLSYLDLQSGKKNHNSDLKYNCQVQNLLCH